MIKSLYATIYSNNNLSSFKRHKDKFEFWSNNEARYNSSYLKLKIYPNRIDITVNIEEWLKSLYIGDLSYQRIVNINKHIYFSQIESMIKDIEETFKFNDDNNYVKVDIRNSIINSIKLVFDISLDDSNFIKHFSPDAENDLHILNDRPLKYDCHDFFIAAGELSGASKSTFGKDSMCYNFSDYNDINYKESIFINKIYDEKTIILNKLNIVYNILNLYEYACSNLIDATNNSDRSTNILESYLNNGKVGTKSHGIICSALLEEVFWNKLVTQLELKLNSIKSNNSSVVLGIDKPNKLKEITDLLTAISTDDNYWDELYNSKKVTKKTAQSNKKKFSEISKNLDNMYFRRSEDLSLTNIQVTSYLYNSFFDVFE